MNSSSGNPRPNGPPSPRSGGRLQLDGWCALLAECRQKPTRKRVHLLRVATLRLQAQVQFWLDRRQPNHPAAQAAKSWTKQARHVRRFLGAVRAFDVHLANLVRLRAMLTTPSGYKPRSSRDSLRQIEALETRFKRGRKKAAKELLGALDDRNGRIQRAVADVAAEPALQRSLVPAIAHGRLSEMLGTIVSAFPRLDALSLHDFRKQLKRVRYLGEIAATGARARQLAATVKAAQSAIGEWHDWEELSAEAKRTSAGKGDLAELLDTLTEEGLERALALCDNLRSEFLSAASTPVPNLPPRKPVRPAEPAVPHEQFLSA
jgi:CHAD domain-containing protein